MDIKNSQRGFFEGKWKSLCDHSTCEKILPSLKNDCFCITCHINHDADVDILSQNGFRYDCLRRGLQNGLNIGSSDQKLAPSGTGCPVEKQFFLLQKVLRETSLPPTVDRRDDARCPTENEITIVYFAELEESLAVFFEGNRQCPGSVLLLMTTSWATREPSQDDLSLSSIMVNTAITADAGGQTYLDNYDPPRRATYVVNHLTGATTDGRRHEGEDIVKFGLECPMASSVKLTKRTDNKLLTRMMCAASGVHHPVTLALVPQDGMCDNMYETMPNITVYRRPASGITTLWLEPLIKNFLAQDSMKPYNKVVVKPFGSYWNSCKGVSFHDIHDLNSMIEAVLELSSRIDRSDGILVESFHSVFKPTAATNIGRHALNVEGRELSFRIRAIACRTPQNGARMTQVLTGVADAGSPFGGAKTIGTSLELTLHRWGVTDLKKQQEIRENLKRCSERLLLTMIKHEEKMSPEERGGVRAQTEMIGIDYILTSINDAITPLVIEVNAHDCLYASSVYEGMNKDIRGEAARTLVQTMIARSQQFLMKNKVVLVVGAGGFSKRNLWKDTQEFGVKVVLVDSNPEHFARRQVHMFLYYDMSDHTRDKEHADVIVHRVKSDVGHVDGCVSFWEDCVPLSSLVAEGLGLTRTPSYTAAMAANAKGLTMKVLSGDYEPPHSPRPNLYASPAVRVTSADELVNAVKQVPLPAILKLEYGSSAVGVKHVKTLQEARAFVQHVQNTLHSEKDHPGVGLGHSRAFVLMSRLEGTEHDVDLAMFEGQVMAAFVSDNGPTRLPSCSETTAAMPSVLNKEQEQQLVMAAATCCRKLDLVTGVFNVELILTPCGPRLVEINARMGGFYLREWIRTVYEVDMLHLALMAACGVQPVAANSMSYGYSSKQAREDRGQLMGMLLYPSHHKQALSTTATLRHLQRLHDQGSIIFRQMEENLEDWTLEFEEPLASIAVKAPTIEEARGKLEGLCIGLGLETEESMRTLLQDFVMT